MATLTFAHDLDMVWVHHHTEFGKPAVNGSGDKNFFLVTCFLVNVKITFFNIVTFTFAYDLRLYIALRYGPRPAPYKIWWPQVKQSLRY